MTLPTGTVTFLFTDIEGSTRLWDAHAATMESVLRRHDQILTAAIEGNGGAVFKHTGDGLCAAFDSPLNALNAALAAQFGLAEEAWPAPIEQVRARMGVHTGTAREQDGDYFGPALNRAARLMSVGHGGQILLSAAAQRLVGDGLPDGVALLDLGSHRLRDLATPEQVYQVCHPELLRDFPPVRTVDSLPGNLPLQVTTFVGREQQMSDLADALSQTRLITLTGVGGVGKTRLALQVALEVLTRFPDGAWFVELAPVGEPDAVPHVVAGILGAQEVPGRTITDTVVEVLRSRTALLIFDNCEHLLDAAGGLVERIVRTCPNVTIIATSREPLAVEGERVWAVTSLAVPPRDEVLSVEDLSQVAAVSLFIDRARAVNPHCEVTPDNAAAIVEICRRLDGVPLALELAAARVRSMAPQEIAERLDERFRLLRSGRRTAMERHQTLRATVEWSYGLLRDDERHLFDRLSVFAGGFILAAAEAVCAGGPIDELDVDELVTSLADKSMLIVEDQADGTTRYRMLETLRQFGEERLVERGEANEVGGAHATYYAELAARAYDGVRGRDESRWVQAVEVEFDNLRAAHAWALANNDLTKALGIPPDLHPYAGWRLRGEVYAWCEMALALSGAEDNERFGDASAAAAFEAMGRGEADRCERLGLVAVEHTNHDDPARYADALMAAGGRSWSDGSQLGFDRMQQAREVAAAGNELVAEAYAGSALALLHTYHGESATAEEHARAAIPIADRSGNPSIRAMARYALGEVLQDREPDAAGAALEEAIAVANSVRARFIAGVALVSLATVRARHGDAGEAARLLIEAMDEWSRRGNWRQQWVTVANVIELFGRLGMHEPAATTLAAMRASSTATTLWGAQAERLRALEAELAEAMGDSYLVAVERGNRLNDDEAVAFARAALTSVREPVARA